MEKIITPVINRKLSHSRYNRKEQLLDQMQIRLMCIHKLGYHLSHALRENAWGDKNKGARNILIIEDMIISNHYKTFTEVSEIYGMSPNRISAMFRKANMIMRSFLLNKITAQCKFSGADMIMDIDDYITHIALSDYSIPAIKNLSVRS